MTLVELLDALKERGIEYEYDHEADSATITAGSEYVTPAIKAALNVHRESLVFLAMIESGVEIDPGEPVDPNTEELFEACWGMIDAIYQKDRQRGNELDERAFDAYLENDPVALYELLEELRDGASAGTTECVQPALL